MIVFKEINKQVFSKVNLKKIIIEYNKYTEFTKMKIESELKMIP